MSALKSSKPPLAWRYQAASHQGRRAAQEDAWGSAAISASAVGAEGEWLLVLADGMGGAAHGAKASRLAVDQMIEQYPKQTSSNIPQRLWNALLGANRALAQTIDADPDLEGMGCTLLAAVATARGFYWISVGDSPLWLWRGNRLTRLNQDHSYRTVLNELVQRGEMTSQQAAHHPSRHALLSAVTGRSLAAVDLPMSIYLAQQGDRLLLASDGLFTLDEQTIAAILASPTASEQLLEAVLAVQQPNQDNVTLIVAEAVPDHTCPAAPSPRELELPDDGDGQTLSPPGG